MKTEKHEGSCLCGTIKFSIEGAFEKFFLCYCTYCQKDTGSAHAANLFSQSADLSWLSGKESVTSFTLPGTRHSRSFCRVCGSAMPSLQMDGKLLVVPAGSLDSRNKLKPNARIFFGSQAGWVPLIESTDAFDRFAEKK